MSCLLQDWLLKSNLQKLISENEAVQFCVNIMESYTIKAKNSYLWYSIGSSMAKFRLKNGSKVTELLEKGIKINIITHKTMKDAGLAIWRGPKLELVFYIGYSRFFLGLWEDVEIVIERLKIRHPIFIIEHGDYELVLGQTFLNLVKFSEKYKPDGIFGTITHPYTQQLAVF